jgi:hypothetical protein
MMAARRSAVPAEHVGQHQRRRRHVREPGNRAGASLGGLTPEGDAAAAIAAGMITGPPLARIPVPPQLSRMGRRFRRPTEGGSPFHGTRYGSEPVSVPACNFGTGIPASRFSGSVRQRPLTEIPSAHGMQEGQAPAMAPGGCPRGARLAAWCAGRQIRLGVASGKRRACSFPQGSGAGCTQPPVGEIPRSKGPTWKVQAVEAVLADGRAHPSGACNQCGSVRRRWRADSSPRVTSQPALSGCALRTCDPVVTLPGVSHISDLPTRYELLDRREALYEDVR